MMDHSDGGPHLVDGGPHLVLTGLSWIRANSWRFGEYDVSETLVKVVAEYKAHAVGIDEIGALAESFRAKVKETPARDSEFDCGKPDGKVTVELTAVDSESLMNSIEQLGTLIEELLQHVALVKLDCYGKIDDPLKSSLAQFNASFHAF